MKGAVASDDDATDDATGGGVPWRHKRWRPKPAAHGGATSGGNAAGRCHSGDIPYAVMHGAAISDSDATGKAAHVVATSDGDATKGRHSGDVP